MPKIGFICPDGKEIRFVDCLSHCRLENRCLTKPILAVLAETRTFDGKPSTTQLINPARLEYLRITRDYYINPKKQAFLLLGIGVHAGLGNSMNGVLREKLYEDDISTGKLDCWEEEGEGILTDHKVWGSYRVARALGIIKQGKQFIVDPATQEIEEETLQLNRYRILLEQQGFPVTKMQLEVIVRDGGTFMARNHGVFEEFYLIPIPRIDDEKINDYFSFKRETLLHALEHNKIPPPCSPKENWDGKRCKSFCDVVDFCPEGSLIKAGMREEK